LVAAVRGRLHRTHEALDSPGTEALLRDDGFAEIVDRLDGRLITNATATTLTAGDPSLLMNGFARRLPSAPDRLDAGDLEYHDDERDVIVPGGDIRRFFVHRGIVRDDAARPLALVVVAQSAPVVH
jgi:hypothetical protein